MIIFQLVKRTILDPSRALSTALCVIVAACGGATPPSPTREVVNEIVSELEQPNSTMKVRLHQFTPSASPVLNKSPAIPAIVNPSGIFNFGRQFFAAGSPYVVMINGNTGSIRVHPIMGGANLGFPVFSHSDPLRFRCSGTAIGFSGLNQYLFLHDSFKGTITRVQIKNDATLDLATIMSRSNDAWRDQNSFTAFLHAGKWKLFSLDTWSGSVTVTDENLKVLGRKTVDSGFSSVDHLYVNPTTTYRISYKASGHPYLGLDEPGDQTGHLVVQRLSGTGVDGLSTDTDTHMPSPVPGVPATGAGWSDVKFLTAARTASGNQLTYSVLFYNRKNGQYEIVPFDGVAGAVSNFAAESGLIDARWTDLDPYLDGMNSRIFGLNYEDVEPFYYDQVERMAHAIDQRLAKKAVGYQLMIAQSGQVIYSRGSGYQRLHPAPIGMTVRDRQDIGSVSKVLTTVSVLKLAQDPAVSLALDDALAEHLDPSEFSADSWVNTMTVKNLLTQTTGMSNSACDRDLDAFTVNCSPFWELARDPLLLQDPASPYDPVTNPYRRSYNNSNFSAARRLIEFHTGTTTSQELDPSLHALWMNDIGLSNDSLSCEHTSNAHYFAFCHGSEGCHPHDGSTWRQSQIIDGWSATCGAGGWSGSSRGLLEFLHAVRYGRVLGASYPEQLALLDTSLESGGAPTAVGWDEPWSAGAVKNLGKNGAKDQNGVAFNAYITRLPNNAEAVLLVNSDGVGATDEVQRAYKFGVSPADYPMPGYNLHDSVQDGRWGVSVHLNEATVTGAGVSNQFVVGSTNLEHELRLTRWTVDTGGQLHDGETRNESSMLGFDISDGVTFASVGRGASNEIRVVGWDASSGLARLGDASDDAVHEVSVAKVADLFDGFRVVTASRTVANQIQVAVWDVPLDGSAVKQRSEWNLSGNVPLHSAVTIATLRAGNDVEPGRVVIAYRNGVGTFTVQIWDVDSNGRAIMAGTAGFGPMNPAFFRRTIAIDTRGTGSDFFDGTRFLTANIDSGEALRVVSWEVDGLGNVSPLEQKLDIYNKYAELDATRASIAGLTSDGKLLLSRWSVSVTGGLYPYGPFTFGPEEKELAGVAAAGRLLTVTSTSESADLTVSNWKPFE